MIKVVFDQPVVKIMAPAITIVIMETVAQDITGQLVIKLVIVAGKVMMK